MDRKIEAVLRFSYESGENCTEVLSSLSLWILEEVTLHLVLLRKKLISVMC